MSDGDGMNEHDQLREAIRLGNEMAESIEPLIASIAQLTADNAELIAKNIKMRDVLQSAWEQWGDDYLWKKWDLGEWP